MPPERLVRVIASEMSLKSSRLFYTFHWLDTLDWQCGRSNRISEKYMFSAYVGEPNFWEVKDQEEKVVTEYLGSCWCDLLRLTTRPTVTHQVEGATAQHISLFPRPPYVGCSPQWFP